MFNHKINQRKSGLLLYGITPPKANNSPEKINDISLKTIERIKGLNIDALVVYDLQDESSRNPVERPFAFFPTLDAYTYVNRYLKMLELPKIIYCSVGKLNTQELETILENNSPDNAMVFVGVPSKNTTVKVTLSDAYTMWNSSIRFSTLGAVAIPERHSQKKNEHLILQNKMENGCSFFITQCVYNIEYVKNLVSDMFYFYKEQNLPFPTVIFTLTPCGSLKTLDFLTWLGIHIPVWLINDLAHSQDILSRSVTLCIKIAEEIIDFCIEKNIPFGLNIESVAIRRDEIEAATYLLEQVSKLLIDRGLRHEQNALAIDGSL
jgi:hypothetical protein